MKLHSASQQAERWPYSQRRARDRWREPSALALLERDLELQLLRRLVLDVRSGESVVVVIDGQSGLGRTALLAQAAHCAGQARLRVAAARCVWTEAKASNAVGRQMLASVGCPPVGGERLRLSSEKFAGQVRDRPLLLVVDDTQWMDDDSRRWLTMTGRRLAGTPMLVLIAGTGVSRSPLAGDLLDFTASLPRVLTLRALTPAGVRQVIESRYDGRVDDDFVAVAEQSTAGNLRVLSTALSEFSANGLAPLATHANALAAFAVSARRNQIAEMVDRAPDDLLPLVRILAAGGPDLGFDLAWTLAGRPGATEAAARGMLAGTGLLAPGPAAPVDQSVVDIVLAGMSVRERENLYARVAEFGHRNVIDDAGVARMLLAARPLDKRWAGEVLRTQAVALAAARQPGQAARLLRRALAEPADLVSRARLLCDLGSAEVLETPDAGDRRFVEVLHARSGPELFGARLGAADLLLARGNPELAQRAIGKAWSQRARGTPELAPLAALYWLAEDTNDAPAAERVLCAVPALPDSPTDPALAGTAAWRVAARGKDAEKARALARMALDIAPDSELPVFPRIQALRTLLLTEDLAEVATGVQALVAETRRSNAGLVRAAVLLVRSELNLRAGRAGQAAGDLADSLAEVPLRCLHPARQPSVLALDIAVNIELGAVDQANRLAGAEPAAGAERGGGWAQLLFYKGMLRLLGGKPRAALPFFSETGRRMMSRQWLNPALLPWRTVAAVANAASGQSGVASQLVNSENRLARLWGTPGVVAHAQLGARLVLDGGLSLDSRIETLAETRKPAWPHSFALLDGILAPDRDDVARSEPGHLPGSTEPSPAERRAAALAAAGRSNADIAHELGITRRTVESHLTSVYRKLGIAGRAELTTALGAGRDTRLPTVHAVTAADG